MKRDFNGLKEPFDLIIIGGGIIGTGAARDAALRGLRTLIVEREDFAFGTTSRSTRLIHGGLRYLAQFDFKLVHQDLHEREILFKIAPHLVHRLEFVIPLLKSAPYYRLTLPFGLWLYNRFSHGSSLPPCNRFSAKDTMVLEPSLKDTEGLVGSYLYYDGQAAYTERLCIENLADASSRGAVTLNHTVMTDFIFKDNTVTGIKIKDALSGEEYQANGRIVLNTSGPWTDSVLHKLEAGRAYTIRKTKGIHLVTDKISDNALVLFSKSDGRLFFVIPLLNYSLIGTTDTDFKGDLDKVHAEKSDVDYMVTELRNYFPSFKRENIHFTYAGLRPLVPSGKKSASKTSRAHRLADHEKLDGLKGFMSVLGGKNTAYRGIAEEAVNLVVNKLGIKAPCITENTPLPGAPALNPQDIEKASIASGAPAATIAHLTSIYGSKFDNVLAYAREDKRLYNPISPGGKDILAQIKHAVREEEALSVSDFIMRRSLICLRSDQGLDTVETVAREMSSLLGWNAAETQKQSADYRATAALGQLYKQ